MIDGFVTGAYLMVALLATLTFLALYGALIVHQVRNRSPYLIISAALPALIIAAGIVGAILA